MSFTVPYPEIVDLAYIADFYAETWKTLPVEGYEHVEVSTMGRVRTLDRYVEGPNGCRQMKKGRIRKLSKHRQGYTLVQLRKGTDMYQTVTHRLVMLTFVGEAPLGDNGKPLEVCHENGRPADNRLSNLRYDTHAGNMADCIKHGTRPAPLPYEEIRRRDRERARARRQDPAKLEQIREQRRLWLERQPAEYFERERERSRKRKRSAEYKAKEHARRHTPEYLEYQREYQRQRRERLKNERNNTK